MEHYVTYHKILDLCEDFQIQSPILKSFGYGNLVDFGKNTSGTTTMYPFMFMVPQSITYDENTTTYQFSILFADILNTDLDNEKDVVSDMSLEARRFISYIKRGMNQNPPLYNYMDIQMPVQAIPWQERFNDHTAGVALQANLIVFEDINACDYYEPCEETIQYLQVDLQENTKFKLVLWNDSGYTSPSVAVCDYIISGTAYGSLGTVYTGQETISSGQHQHQFNLAPVLLPGEIITSFNVISYQTSGCICPVDLNLPLPLCTEYQATPSTFPISVSWNGCDGVPTSHTFTDLTPFNFCASSSPIAPGSVTINNLGICTI